MSRWVLVLISAAILFLQRPEVLDETQGYFSYLLSFLLFLVFFMSTLGLGSKVLGSTTNRFQSLAVGSLLMATIAGLCALVPQFFLSPWLFALILCFGVYHFERNLLVIQFPKTKLNQILFTLLGVDVCLRVIEGFSLHGHGDSMICYLNTSRVLAENHSFTELLSNPIYFLSSSWENLYLWGQVFFAKAPHVGLASGQRFGQWCTALIAHFGILGITYEFTRYFLSKRKETPDEERIQTYALLASLMVMSIPVLRWMQNLAKNDLGVIFWALSGVYFLFRYFQSQKQRELFFAGSFLGAAIIGKISILPISAGVILLFLLMRLSLMSYFLMGISTLLGMLPIVLRNSLLTQNPFFPWFGQWFSTSAMTQTMKGNFNHASNASHTTFQLEFLTEPFLQKPVMVILPLLMLYAFYQERKTAWKLRPLSLYLLLLTVYLLLYIRFLRPMTELRYFGPGLVLLGIAFVFCLENLKIKRIFEDRLLWCLAIGLMATSDMPFFTLKQMFGKKYFPGTERISEHSTSGAKKWIRQNHPTSKVIAIGDNETYYMISYDYREIEYYKPLNDRVFPIIGDFKALVHALKQDGYQYLVDAYFLRNVWGGGPGQVYNAYTAEYRAIPSSIVYDDGKDRIVDLNLLPY